MGDARIRGDFINGLTIEVEITLPDGAKGHRTFTLTAVQSWSVFQQLKAMAKIGSSLKIKTDNPAFSSINGKIVKKVRPIPAGDANYDHGNPKSIVVDADGVEHAVLDRDLVYLENEPFR